MKTFSLATCPDRNLRLIDIRTIRFPVLQASCPKRLQFAKSKHSQFHVKPGYQPGTKAPSVMSNSARIFLFIGVDFVGMLGIFTVSSIAVSVT